MRSFVPAIYDCTLAIPKNQPPPTILRMFRGQSSVVGWETLSAYANKVACINC